MIVLYYFIAADVLHAGCVVFHKRGITMPTLGVTNIWIVDAMSDGLKIGRLASPTQI
jgi:hypothetical protein